MVTTVSIVIPTWNRKADCLLCLDSVLKLEYPKEKLEIFVVDNASTDGTKEAIAKSFPQVVVLALRINKGFGGGVNEAIRASKGKYVYILDHDVVVAPNALKELVSVLDKDESIGFAAGKLYDFYERNKFQTLYGRLNTSTFHVNKVGNGEIDRGQYNKKVDTDFVSIGSGLARRKMLEKVGLLDERYFIYFDDTDLFASCQRAGYKIIYLPTAKAWHKGSQTLGKDSSQLLYYLQRNNLLIRQKFNGFTFLDHLRNLRFLFSLFFPLLLTKKKKDHQASIRGMIDFYLGRFGKRS